MNRRYSILIIDDDPDDHFFIKSAIKEVSEKIDVISTFNGLQGLGHLAFSNLTQGNLLPDLIICDINMSVMDGVTFLEHVKISSDFRKIPIAILSTDMDSETIRNLLKCGAMDFIIKPDYSANYRIIIASILNKISAFNDL